MRASRRSLRLNFNNSINFVREATKTGIQTGSLWNYPLKEMYCNQQKNLNLIVDCKPLSNPSL